MLAYRVTTYTFCNCELSLSWEKGAFWVYIKCDTPLWELICPSPNSCPQRAMMLAELEVLKAKLNMDESPAGVLALKKCKEIVLATNRNHRRLFGINFKGDLVSNYISSENLLKYQQFLKEAKSKKTAIAKLSCLNADGNEINLIVEGKIIPSPISLYPVMYTRIIERL